MSNAENLAVVLDLLMEHGYPTPFLFTRWRRYSNSDGYGGYGGGYGHGDGDGDGGGHGNGGVNGDGGGDDGGYGDGYPTRVNL